MKQAQAISRRQFVQNLAATGASLALGRADLGAESAQPWPVIVFSKAFQELSYEDTAALVAEVGWDGIECPVRKGGQVAPERAADDLPRMVEALGKQGRKLGMMTTDITGAGNPAQVKLLELASKLGIRHYRLGAVSYTAGKPLGAQIAERKAALKDLAAVNRDLGLCGGFQNHSGSNTMGAPVWDIYEAIRELDPRRLGIFFDIAHATVEGGYAWTLHARLMEPYYASVYVKDFAWKKTNRGWNAAWCPLGEGMVNPAFFQTLKKSAFQGPVSHHLEYPIGQGAERLALLKRDLATLRGWLAR